MRTIKKLVIQAIVKRQTLVILAKKMKLSPLIVQDLIQVRLVVHSRVKMDKNRQIQSKASVKTSWFIRRVSRTFWKVVPPSNKTLTAVLMMIKLVYSVASVMEDAQTQMVQQLTHKAEVVTIMKRIQMNVRTASTSWTLDSMLKPCAVSA